MERRLKVFERIGVRNISTFNAKQQSGEFEHYDNPPAKMPQLVIIIDELSDLMMVAGKDVEASIVRIAQPRRGHPPDRGDAASEPNVVTGLIKANITNRIASSTSRRASIAASSSTRWAPRSSPAMVTCCSQRSIGVSPSASRAVSSRTMRSARVVEFVKGAGRLLTTMRRSFPAVAPAMVGGSFWLFWPRTLLMTTPLIWEAAQIVVESQPIHFRAPASPQGGYARAGRIMDMS